MTHLSKTDEGLQESVKAAEENVHETEAGLLGDIAAEVGHMETEAGGRAQKFGSTGNALLDSLSGFTNDLEKRAADTTSQSQEQYDAFLDKADTWKKNVEKKDETTLAMASTLLSQAGDMNRELDSIKRDADRGFGAASALELRMRKEEKQ